MCAYLEYDNTWKVTQSVRVCARVCNIYIISKGVRSQTGLSRIPTGKLKAGYTNNKCLSHTLNTQ